MGISAVNKLEKLGFEGIYVSPTLDLYGNDDSIISFTWDNKRYQIYESSFINLLTVEPDPLPSRVLKLVC